VPKDGSHHPPSQKPEPVALQDKSTGLTQAPVTSHCQPTQAQAGDSALNIAHEPRSQAWPCRGNRPCTMLSWSLPNGAPSLRRANVFFPEPGRGTEGAYGGFHQLSMCGRAGWGSRPFIAP
jgi:hypothetical protein